ncbi:MAG: acyl-CoA dehydrogenase [Geodermatophilaceae bacterium]|nr:acyl-CoA dehydrogenase [Geodermatophilaceae bacterium]
MTHYKSNVRDLTFNLFEVLRIQDWLGSPPFDHMDPDTAASVLTEFDRLATGPLAASFVDADRNPPVFDPATHSVTLPESLKMSCQAYLDGDWQRLNVPGHLGGYGAPPTVQWACAEMLLGANPALFLYMVTGPAFASVIDSLGTPEQQAIARLAIERQWGASMVLTEPDAGSDVGAGRSRAVEQPDGTWHIEGTKRFITSGDWDYTENILHLVLARPQGAGPGTKGLSLFIVPKFLFDAETGELGARNGVFATGMESKMGLKASATCDLTFGERQPAVGYLLGGVHRGIGQMFMVIEGARMMVGTKAIATLSTGYLNALEYAKTRLQGADLTRSTDPAAPRVPITAHADVRRSLMLQKSYAEGMRALYLYTASWQDHIRRASADNGIDLDLAKRINDLLLPIVKGFGSERAYALLGSESLQVFGGSGYLTDYPIEQYIRDSKIDTLYEGTTAIQGMDLFFRKIVKDQGRALTALLGEIQSFLDNEAGNGRLKAERALLATALSDTQAMVASMVGQLTSAQEDMSNVYKVGQNTTRLLLAFGDLLTGWLLLRHAEVALAAVGGETSAKDRAFYEGKIASARFFAAQVLPRLSAERTLVENTDNSLMEIPEESF